MEATTAPLRLLYGREEAAKALGVSLRTLDQMHAERQIIATKIRGSVRFSLAELERVAREGTAAK